MAIINPQYPLIKPPAFQPALASPFVLNYNKRLQDQMYAFTSATLSQNAKVQSYYNHGLVGGERIVFKDVAGVPGINDFVFQVTRVDDGTFSLDGTWGPFLSGTYTTLTPSGGWRVLGEDHFFAGSFFDITADGISDVAIQTPWAHGLQTGDGITIENVNGITGINDSFTITLVDDFNFTLDSSSALTGTWDGQSGRWISDHKGSDDNPFTPFIVPHYPSDWSAFDWAGRPLLHDDIIPIVFNDILGLQACSLYGPQTATAGVGNVNMVKAFDRDFFYGKGRPIVHPRTLVMALGPYPAAADGPLPGVKAAFEDVTYLNANIRPYGVCPFVTICDRGPLSETLPCADRDQIVFFNTDLDGNPLVDDPRAFNETPLPNYIVGGDLLVIGHVTRWRAPTDTPDGYPESRQGWIDMLQFSADNFRAIATAFLPRFRKFRILLFTPDSFSLNNVDEIWQDAIATLAGTGFDCEFRLVSSATFFDASTMIASEVANFFS